MNVKTIPPPQRIQFLDGLRGLAILLVVFFHAYVTRPEHHPYGDSYADLPVISHGWLGVQLFFLISGFVIFMTLDKTATFREFIYKRWLRLFPAMLIASVLIYLTAPLLPERPQGIPDMVSLLPGLTFTLPSWWSKLLGFEISGLEMTFWSLYVEFKFYIIAGVIYFSLGRKFLIPVLLALYCSWVVAWSLSGVMDFWLLNTLKKITIALSLKHFGWFAAGAAFYSYFQYRDNRWFYAAILMTIPSVLTVRLETLGLDTATIIGALLIVALFAISFKSTQLQRLLQSRVLLFFGFISYPLYLIHENAMSAMIAEMPNLVPWLHPFFYPYPAIIALVVAAFVISRYLELGLAKILDIRRYLGNVDHKQQQSAPNVS